MGKARRRCDSIPSSPAWLPVTDKTPCFLGSRYHAGAGGNLSDSLSHLLQPRTGMVTELLPLAALCGDSTQRTSSLPHP